MAMSADELAVAVGLGVLAVVSFLFALQDSEPLLGLIVAILLAITYLLWRLVGLLSTLVEQDEPVPHQRSDQQYNDPDAPQGTEQD